MLAVCLRKAAANALSSPRPHLSGVSSYSANRWLCGRKRECQTAVLKTSCLRLHTHVRGCVQFVLGSQETAGSVSGLKA